jgi:hypothetical protein
VTATQLQQLGEGLQFQQVEPVGGRFCAHQVHRGGSGGGRLLGIAAGGQRTRQFKMGRHAVEVVHLGTALANAAQQAHGFVELAGARKHRPRTVSAKLRRQEGACARSRSICCSCARASSTSRAASAASSGRTRSCTSLTAHVICRRASGTVS